jgi:hypothetical protein
VLSLVKLLARQALALHSQDLMGGMSTGIGVTWWCDTAKHEQRAGASCVELQRSNLISYSPSCLMFYTHLWRIDTDTDKAVDGAGN